MPSFDVVSKINLAELDNAIQQTVKEVQSRYDFQGTKTEITLADDKKSIVLKTKDDEKMEALFHMLLAKLSKRGIPLRGIQGGKNEPSALGQIKQTVTLQQGIPTDKAKQLIKAIKDTKMKVQASIQGEELRVTGKNRDDLQEAMGLLREKQDSVKLDLQFTNFRD